MAWNMLAYAAVYVYSSHRLLAAPACVSLCCLALFRITTVLSDAFIPKNCTTSELLFKIFILLGGWFTLQNGMHYTMAVLL
jgi:hypothetical protein